MNILQELFIFYSNEIFSFYNPFLFITILVNFVLILFCFVLVDILHSFLFCVPFISLIFILPYFTLLNFRLFRIRSNLDPADSRKLPAKPCREHDQTRERPLHEEVQIGVGQRRAARLQPRLAVRLQALREAVQVEVHHEATRTGGMRRQGAHVPVPLLPLQGEAEGQPGGAHKETPQSVGSGRAGVQEQNGTDPPSQISGGRR